MVSLCHIGLALDRFSRFEPAKHGETDHEHTARIEKKFVQVAARALHLFCCSTDAFFLTALCKRGRSPSRCGDQLMSEGCTYHECDAAFPGQWWGPHKDGVQWTNVPPSFDAVFPPATFDFAKPFILVPRPQFNACADFVGFFPVRTEPRTVCIVLFQCKDHFVAPEDAADEVVDFRAGWDFVTKDKCAVTTNRTAVTMDNVETAAQTREVTLETIVLHNAFPVQFSQFMNRRGVDYRFVHILVTTNPVDDTRWGTTQEHEGLFDIERMKHIMPTVGYNAQACHRLRQLFAPGRRTEMPPE